MTHPLPKEVAAFLSSLDNPKRVSDATTVLAMMQTITNLPPKMWGTSLIGFDSYHYKYDSGREGDSFVTGLSPRKQKLVIYITPGFDGYQHLLDKLGKHKTSVSCLYINKLEDIDLKVLEQLIAQAHKDMKAKYPDGSG
jgi:hypothetical protein